LKGLSPSVSPSPSATISQVTGRDFGNCKHRQRALNASKSRDNGRPASKPHAYHRRPILEMLLVIIDIGD
jgi:hypothetical protein